MLTFYAYREEVLTKESPSEPFIFPSCLTLAPYARLGRRTPSKQLPSCRAGDAVTPTSHRIRAWLLLECEFPGSHLFILADWLSPSRKLARQHLVQWFLESCPPFPCCALRLWPVCLGVEIRQRLRSRRSAYSRHLDALFCVDLAVGWHRLTGHFGRPSYHFDGLGQATNPSFRVDLGRIVVYCCLSIHLVRGRGLGLVSTWPAMLRARRRLMTVRGSHDHGFARTPLQAVVTADSPRVGRWSVDFDYFAIVR